MTSRDHTHTHTHTPLNPKTNLLYYILFLSRTKSLFLLFSFMVLNFKLRLVSCCSVKFRSAAQLCLTLSDPMSCSTPGLPVHHQLQKLIQAPVHWVSDAIQPSHALSSPSPSCPQSFPASGYFQMSQFFKSGGQSFGVSASISVLPMITQDWSPLGWTGWISLQSKGFSRIYSNTTGQKNQFFGAQISL